MTTARTFTGVAVASRDSLVHRPQELATVIAATRADLEAQIAAAGMRRTGGWKQSVMWARGDDTTTPHSWRRCRQAQATARVVRITATGVTR